MKRLFDQPSDMEPLLPEDRDGSLAVLALSFIRKAERLRSSLHPITRKAVAELVRSMNSNAIRRASSPPRPLTIG